jgi:D-alanyl-D-alanine carboxypeptidase
MLHSTGASNSSCRARAPFRASSPGPGVDGAGLAIFGYRTRCGTVYGHTGVTFAYTQFAVSTSNGARSATVSINSRMTPSENPQAFAPLGRVFDFAVCAALAGT